MHRGDPARPQGRLGLLPPGKRLDREEDYDRAIADFTEAIRLDPKDDWAYYYRAQSWNAKGEYDKAIADLTEAIRLDPNDASVYYFAGPPGRT